MSCGVGHRQDLDPELLWLWCRPAATALIRPLVWEPPYAAGAALEKAKRQKKKNNSAYPNLNFFYLRDYRQLYVRDNLNREWNAISIPSPTGEDRYIDRKEQTREKYSADFKSLATEEKAWRKYWNGQRYTTQPLVKSRKMIMHLKMKIAKRKLLCQQKLVQKELKLWDERTFSNL